MTDVPAPDDGLTEISTHDLRQLLHAIEKGLVQTPFSPQSLPYVGLGRLEPALLPFSGLDQAQLLALVRVVLAERRHSAKTHLALVWSGSDAGPSYARYTKIVVPELIERAMRQITIAGYSFDEGAGVFAGLRKAMHERGVTARLFLDVEQLYQRLSQQLRKDPLHRPRLAPVEQARGAGPTPFAREVLGLFRELHWPFPEAPPALYYDPRTADQRSFSSLHAKCLIVDHEHVLITSANFTSRGQDRNIEVGVVVHDAGYASTLELQWNNLVESGDVLLG